MSVFRVIALKEIVALRQPEKVGVVDFDARVLIEPFCAISPRVPLFAELVDRWHKITGADDSRFGFGAGDKLSSKQAFLWGFLFHARSKQRYATVVNFYFYGPEGLRTVTCRKSGRRRYSFASALAVIS